MFDGTTIILIALTYVSALFVLAWLGDRMLTVGTSKGRPLIYALSLGDLLQLMDVFWQRRAGRGDRVSISYPSISARF